MSARYLHPFRTVRRRAILPAYWRYVKHSRVLDRLEELRARYWDSPDQNRAAEARKLHELLKHASEHIPYYRRVVRKRGMRLREDRVFDDLAEFPVLTRQLVREHFDELCDGRDASRYLNRSGGSTGEPLAFYQNKTYRDWAQAAKLLFNEWAGCRLGDRIVKLWGSERDVFAGSQGIKGKVSSHLHNIKLFNAFNMSREDMAEFLRRLERWEPVLIEAYVEPIYEVARFAAEEGCRVSSPNAILTSAGTLFQDFRRQIQSVFRAPVFDRYGTREVGDVACECAEHVGLHLVPLTHVVEIVDQDGESCPKGEAGELLITLLTNYTMPLIRYKVGDRAAMSDKTCSCGRSSPMLERIEGRSTSCFRNQRGDVVSPEYFIHLIGVSLNRDGTIKTFQVIQERIDLVVVRLVVEGNDRNRKRTLMAEIRDKIQLVMGKNTEIRFALVDEIPPSASGKYLYTISKIDHVDG